MLELISYSMLSFHLHTEEREMTIKQVIKHYGSIAETAAALGVTYQAVQQWVTNGKVPEGRQWQIETLTKGKLKAKRAA